MEISSMNALEVAIEGSAKNFVSSPLVQRLLGKKVGIDNAGCHSQQKKLIDYIFH